MDPLSRPLTSITIFIIFATLVNAQFPTHPTLIKYICNSTANGTYADNTPFHTNLNSLLSDLKTRSAAANLYSSSAGSGPNTSYGFYYCRRDLSRAICSDCVSAAVQTAQPGGSCYRVVSAALFYQECTVRFSNRSLAGVMEYRPRWYRWYSTTVPDNFYQVLNNAMDRLMNKAAYGESSGGFATEEDDVNGLVKLYSLVQCRPDLNASLCLNCLQTTFEFMSDCCTYQAEWMLAFTPSCQLRFGLTPFVEGSIASPPAVAPAPQSSISYRRSGKSSSYYVRIGVPIAAGMLLLAVVFGGWFWWHRRNYHRFQDVANEDHDGPAIGNIECFDLRTIHGATMKFSKENKLGQGGFGSVYKGVLPNGQIVAVKRLKGTSAHHMQEFKTEVAVVAKLQHRNLVRLVGYCVDHEERILVYDFLPNLSLDKVLFDATKSVRLDWRTRYKIIEGIAWGLRYLHLDSLLNIVHRDLKSSNILLDKNMNPKIADFGLAKLVEIDATTLNTSIVAGTRGYMAPEYAMRGSFSVKSDMYSFGVMVLEIISGKSINEFYDSVSSGGLLHYGWRLWNERAIELLIDPAMQNNYSSIEVERCAQIGLLCAQDDVDKRPPIRAVVNFLENPSLELPLPSAPSSFFLYTHSSAMITSQGGQTQSSQMESEHYSNELDPR